MAEVRRASRKNPILHPTPTRTPPRSTGLSRSPHHHFPANHHRAPVRRLERALPTLRQAAGSPRGHLSADSDRSRSPPRYVQAIGRRPRRHHPSKNRKNHSRHRLSQRPLRSSVPYQSGLGTAGPPTLRRGTRTTGRGPNDPH